MKTFIENREFDKLELIPIDLQWMKQSRFTTTDSRLATESCRSQWALAPNLKHAFEEVPDV